MAKDSFDLVIRNARVVTAAEEFVCDIGVAEGQIAALGRGLPSGRDEIDAQLRYVTPGGIDAHCHLDEPRLPPIRMADNFESGTRSAACGGTTTVIPFALQQKGQSLRDAVNDYHDRASGNAHLDYGFHLIVSDPTPEVIADELPSLIREGYTSFKVYMTYDDLKLSDRQILDVLEVAQENRATVMIHAENSECIAWLTERLERKGNIAPRYHARARPAIVEREATHRAISLSQLVGVPILIVHVSGEDAIEQIRWARSQGLTIYAETCPQYLFLTAEDLGIDDTYSSARHVCSPPPRDKASQEAVWKGLADGLFTVFSSDHAPFRFDSTDGKRPGGKELPFSHIPNGVPGLETRMPLLWSEGVMKGRLSPQKFVELTATGPAKTYGLTYRKGSIAIGYDADLVVWDRKNTRITSDMLHHDVDYTPYEGFELEAWPGVVIAGGDVIWNGKAFLPRIGKGQFIARKPSVW